MVKRPVTVNKRMSGLTLPQLEMKLCLAWHPAQNKNGLFVTGDEEDS